MSRVRPNIRVAHPVRLITDVRQRRETQLRYLRADASPNWSQRVHEKEGELMKIASRPAVTITATSTILEALELMSSRRIRGLVVVDSSGRLRGTLTATDVIDYLGGGRAFMVLRQRHKGDIYSALTHEYVENLMNPSPLYATTASKISEALKIMVINGVGFIPVVDRNLTPVGVVTEHDMVRHLGTSEVKIKVSSIMSTTIVAVFADCSLKRAAELMSIYGFRRLPVVSREDGSIVGILSALDFIGFFGSHEALKRASSYDIDDVLSTPVGAIMTKEVQTINQEADVYEAIQAMNAYGTNSLIVVNESGDATGLITERDVLVAIASQR